LIRPIGGCSGIAADFSLWCRRSAHIITALLDR
jgi:hypothetical protein